MTLTITSDAAWGGNSNTGTISCNYQAPAGGYLSTDYAVLFVAIHKASQAGTEVPATPSGWTLLGNLEGGVNTAAAADVGLCRIYAYGRNPAGGESGSLSITINNNTSGVSGTNAVARQFHIRSDTASTYDVAFASGDDNTGGTSWSVTFSSNPGITSGDVLLTAAALPTDTLPTGIPGTLAATGATIGANTVHGTGSSALGLDGTGQAFANTVTAGTASAAPTWTATLSGTTTNWAGPAAIVRVREVVAAADIPYALPRTGYSLTSGVYWQQGDRRDANRIGSVVAAGFEPAGLGAQWSKWRRDPVALQQRQLESPPGLLDTAQLEVPPPLIDPIAVTHLRAPWLRLKQVQSDQSAAPAAPNFDPTQSGYGPEWHRWQRDLMPWLRIKQTQADQSTQPSGAAFDPTLAGYSVRHVWRRDPYAPTQRLMVQNPDDLEIVGTGATMAWWGVDDSAHHFAQWLPGASDPALLVSAGTPADPTQAGYGPRWMWYRLPTGPQQRQLKSVYGLLDTALLEVPPPLSIAYGLAATQQRLPWLRIKQQQYDQSTAVIITDLDPTLSGGYGPEWHRWYRALTIPQQRQLESAAGLLDTALLENELLGSVDDLARHRTWSARPWFGLQRAALADQATQTAPDADPTLGGYGPRWMWYRAPVAPMQRDRESDPRLLLTALLEDALLGGADDLLRHRTWHVDRREVPQQRSYYQEPPTAADPRLTVGAEWRYKLIPATHAPRPVLRLQIRYMAFQGQPPVLFEGTIVGGVLGGASVTGGGTIGGSLTGWTRDGHVTGEVR